MVQKGTQIFLDEWKSLEEEFTQIFLDGWKSLEEEARTRRSVFIIYFILFQVPFGCQSSSWDCVAVWYSESASELDPDGGTKTMGDDPLVGCVQASRALNRSGYPILNAQALRRYRCHPE